MKCSIFRFVELAFVAIVGPVILLIFAPANMLYWYCWSVKTFYRDAIEEWKMIVNMEVEE